MTENSNKIFLRTFIPKEKTVMEKISVFTSRTFTLFLTLCLSMDTKSNFYQNVTFTSDAFVHHRRKYLSELKGGGGCIIKPVQIGIHLARQQTK